MSAFALENMLGWLVDWMVCWLVERSVETMVEKKELLMVLKWLVDLLEHLLGKKQMV